MERKTECVKLWMAVKFDVAKRTIAATKLTEGDMLLTVRVLEGEESLILRSDKEYFLRLEASEIPQKKKGAVGVRGMRLAAVNRCRRFMFCHRTGRKSSP